MWINNKNKTNMWQVTLGITCTHIHFSTLNIKLIHLLLLWSWDFKSITATSAMSIIVLDVDIKPVMYIMTRYLYVYWVYTVKPKTWQILTVQYGLSLVGKAKIGCTAAWPDWHLNNLFLWKWDKVSYYISICKPKASRLRGIALSVLEVESIKIYCSCV